MTKLTDQEAEDLQYICIQSGGFFYEACLRKGFVQENESCVITYKQFILFMNENEVTRPSFSSLSYDKCLSVTRQLNNSIFEARNGLLQDTEKEG